MRAHEGGMSQYNVLGLMYTRTCPLACAHCISDSSPEVRERLQFREAMAYIEAIARFSTKICFTGGEPLVYYRDVTRLIRHAKSLNLSISLVTGGGWVHTEVQTRSRVSSLVDAGLDGLWISWDNYHGAFLPSERAVMLARIATEAGLKVTVRTVTSADQSSNRSEPLFAGLPVAFEEQRVIKLGRATSLPFSQFASFGEAPKGTCSSVYSSVIESDGNVYACCGPAHFCKKPSPLFLGNARREPLDDILARGLEDPILLIIQHLGPYGLFQILKANPADFEKFTPRSTYTGFCQLCLDITNDAELVATLRKRLSQIDLRKLVEIAQEKTKQRSGRRQLH